MIQNFSRYGFSVGQGTSLTTTYDAVFEIKDDSNIPSADKFPNNCNINAIEVSLTGMNAVTVPTIVTLFLTRDSTGDRPIVPGMSTGSSQTITGGQTANTGGVIFLVDADYHFDKRSGAGGSSTQGSIYAQIKLNAGTIANFDIRVSWRS